MLSTNRPFHSKMQELRSRDLSAPSEIEDSVRYRDRQFQMEREEEATSHDGSSPQALEDGTTAQILIPQRDVIQQADSLGTKLLTEVVEMVVRSSMTSMKNDVEAGINCINDEPSEKETEALPNEVHEPSIDGDKQTSSSSSKSELSENNNEDQDKQDTRNDEPKEASEVSDHNTDSGHDKPDTDDKRSSNSEQEIPVEANTINDPNDEEKPEEEEQSPDSPADPHDKDVDVKRDSDIDDARPAEEEEHISANLQENENNSDALENIEEALENSPKQDKSELSTDSEEGSSGHAFKEEEEKPNTEVIVESVQAVDDQPSSSESSSKDEKAKEDSNDKEKNEQDHKKKKKKDGQNKKKLRTEQELIEECKPLEDADLPPLQSVSSIGSEIPSLSPKQTKTKEKSKTSSSDSDKESDPLKDVEVVAPEEIEEIESSSSSDSKRASGEQQMSSLSFESDGQAGESPRSLSGTQKESVANDDEKVEEVKEEQDQTSSKSEKDKKVGKVVRRKVVKKKLEEQKMAKQEEDAQPIGEKKTKKVVRKVVKKLVKGEGEGKKPVVRKKSQQTDKPDEEQPTRKRRVVRRKSSKSGSETPQGEQSSARKRIVRKVVKRKSDSSPERKSSGEKKRVVRKKVPKKTTQVEAPELPLFTKQKAPPELPLPVLVVPDSGKDLQANTPIQPKPAQETFVKPKKGASSARKVNVVIDLAAAARAKRSESDSDSMPSLDFSASDSGEGPTFSSISQKELRDAVLDEVSRYSDSYSSHSYYDSYYTDDPEEEKILKRPKDRTAMKLLTPQQLSPIPSPVKGDKEVAKPAPRPKKKGRIRRAKTMKKASTKKGGIV